MARLHVSRRQQDLSIVALIPTAMLPLAIGFGGGGFTIVPVTLLLTVVTGISALTAP